MSSSAQLVAPLRIAYVQVGTPEHGICRYGRILAAEARRRADLVVLEENFAPSGDSRSDGRRLAELGRRTSDADLVHLQVTPFADGSWGRGWRGLANLRSFHRHCRAPLVVTLHDCNGLAELGCGRPFHLTRRVAAETARVLYFSARRLAKQLLRGPFRPRELFAGIGNWSPLYAVAVARAAAKASSRLLVITESERKVLEATGLARDAVLIPHFVERVPEPVGTTDPPPSAPMKTVVVAGFIFHSKGHQIMLEAMQHLPNVRVVFVGGKSLASFGSSHYSSLLGFAREQGVHERLEVTGYLPEAEYRERLRAADLAVCPFDETKSASGSLSSLIASGCPVLASDIPLIAEYNALVPGAIPTFGPRTPEALADAIRRALAAPREELTRGLAELRRRLSISAIYDRHLEAYGGVIRGRPLHTPVCGSVASS